MCPGINSFTFWRLTSHLEDCTFGERVAQDSPPKSCGFSRFSASMAASPKCGTCATSLMAPAKARKDETYKFEIRKTNLECPPESMRYQIQYSWRRKRECPRPGSHTSQRARCMRHPKVSDGDLGRDWVAHTWRCLPCVRPAGCCWVPARTHRKERDVCATPAAPQDEM